MSLSVWLWYLLGITSLDLVNITQRASPSRLYGDLTSCIILLTPVFLRIVLVHHDLASPSWISHKDGNVLRDMDLKIMIMILISTCVNFRILQYSKAIFRRVMNSSNLKYI